VNYPAAQARPLPQVKASAYVLADAGTGQVLAAKDPHGRYLPASTLKVLTAITLMPVLDPNATVVTTRRAATVEPSKVGLLAGRAYRISDLFKAMLLISANDAAMSVAQATGSVAKGVAMMNAEAHHLQAYDTVARRPNGLNGPGQHVSAYDEALFARQALTIAQFRHDELLRTTRFPLKPHRKPITLYNQNTMLGSYRGDLGGKTRPPTHPHRRAPAGRAPGWCPPAAPERRCTNGSPRPGGGPGLARGPAGQGRGAGWPARCRAPRRSPRRPREPRRARFPGRPS